ncbi:MAG: hypothetical protein ABFS86_01465 [Planctomycetota bacterium]
MVRRLLLLLFAVLLLAGTARAHIPPPYWVYAIIEDEEVIWGLVVDEGIFAEWFGIKAAVLAEATEEEKKALASAVEEFFAEFTEVEIDRVPVRGRLEDVKIDLIDVEQWPYAHLTVAFATKGAPKRVSLTWKKWESEAEFFMPGIDAEIEYGEEADYFLFSRKEPQYIWHAPREDAAVDPFRAPDPVRGTKLPVPILSLAFVLAGLAAFPMLRSRPRLRIGSSILAVALAVALAGVAVAEVRLPWGSGFERPSEAEATEVFTALHRNIYRAFDFEEEDAVYDTLRLSVTGDLLDKIYTEIFTSLIARDQGGAIVSVKSTKILALDVAFPDDPSAPWFGAVCRWQVHGQITHSGHTHVRVNAYQADFTVVLEDGGWRIATVSVTAQERLDTQRFGREPGNELDGAEELK